MNKIYNITQSIGKLNANQMELPYDVPVDKSLYKLTAEKNNLRTWIDYGTLSEDEITFYQDGESKYITIDGYTFDNRVGIYEKFVMTQNRIEHSFSINGKTPKGKIFEIQFYDEINGIDPIIKLIYSMVITTIVGEDRVETVWKQLTKFDYYMNIEEIIPLVKDLKNIAKTIEDKFPFLSLFFQNAIHSYIQIGKNKMDSFELFN
ncbi:MAG: hypothetical protein K2K75_00890 [Muribaculaceae bacterium]|nr:hypothetical protein [Muribaculaceae bacterium]